MQQHALLKRPSLISSVLLCSVNYADSHDNVYRSLNIKDLPYPEGLKGSELRCADLTLPCTFRISHLAPTAQHALSQCHASAKHLGIRPPDPVRRHFAGAHCCTQMLRQSSLHALSLA